MEWYPAKFFTDARPETPYALLLLNQPLNVRAYQKVARDASMIICVDGGANQLHRILQQDKHTVNRFPNAIVGDLDSLKDDAHHFFSDGGATQIVYVPEQDSTDFMKALRWLKKHSAGEMGNHVDVVALGGLGGRVDHGFSMIHHLFMAANDPQLLGGDIYLLSEQSLSFVLEKGVNRIHGMAPGQSKVFQRNVGIIPIRGPATISTKGLEWDVKDWKTEIGGQISTSNHIEADMVEVETSDRMLFTVELAELLCAQ